MIWVKGMRSQVKSFQEQRSEIIHLLSIEDIRSSNADSFSPTTGPPDRTASHRPVGVLKNVGHRWSTSFTVTVCWQHLHRTSQWMVEIDGWNWIEMLINNILLRIIFNVSCRTFHQIYIIIEYYWYGLNMVDQYLNSDVSARQLPPVPQEARVGLFSCVNCLGCLTHSYFTLFLFWFWMILIQFENHNNLIYKWKVVKKKVIFLQRNFNKHFLNLKLHLKTLMRMHFWGG